MANDNAQGSVVWVGAVLLATALCGCSGGAAVTLPKPSGAVALVAPSKQTPIFAPAWERVAADVTILGISAGTLETRLAGGCAQGTRVVDFKTAMQTTGLVRLFARRDGEATTRMDGTNGIPESTSIWVDDGTAMRRYAIRYRPGSFDYTYERTDGPTKQGVARVPGGEHAHDLQSAFVLLRSWRPPKNTRGYFHVVLGFRLWRADVVYRGSETISVAGVERKAVKVEGIAHKLVKKPKDEDKPRSFTLWFSDDDTRSPLKVVGEARFGTVEFDLTAHEVRPSSQACPKPEGS
jgi:hypothetical protein